MKLVTFRMAAGREGRAAVPGVLVEGGTKVAVLPGFSSILEIVAFRAIGKNPPPAWYERPIFYHPSRFSVCGPDAEVPWPAYTERLDFELEFGCYIGKPGKDIPKERAREEWGRGNSRDMHWNGCGLEQMRFLKPGDIVELEVEGIGTLRNKVVK